jgi:hypothetical protein
VEIEIDGEPAGTFTVGSFGILIKTIPAPPGAETLAATCEAPPVTTTVSIK